MFETRPMTGEGDEFYSEVAEQMGYLLKGESNMLANLSNASALLNMVLADINWVGFYLVQGDELVLGPFQGKPACVRIAVGKGVCGTAVANRSMLIVPDVLAFPGHITCDAASRSEIVVPIYVTDQVIGILDIDSPTVGRFTQVDGDGLQKVVYAIEQATDWSDAFAHSEEGPLH